MTDFHSPISTCNIEYFATKQRPFLLQTVREKVESALAMFLHDDELMALEVQERRDLVQLPVRIDIQVPSGLPQSLPPSTDILDIFDEYSGRLLILGEPGSGKTVTLLDLARKLIERAWEEPTQPLPVVFNLASWAEKQQDFNEWLIGELEEYYCIPSRLGRYWVEKRRLLLMLDNLDRISRGRDRIKCIEAINAYSDFRTKLVVCSRLQEYEEVTSRAKLAMWQAILLSRMPRETSASVPIERMKR